jgi:hypothetical protein
MLTGQFSYNESKGLHRGVGFFPLLMAALRVADSGNFERIRVMFPDVVRELEARRAAPGGVLTVEQEAEIEAMHRPDPRVLLDLGKSYPEGPHVDLEDA